MSSVKRSQRDIRRTLQPGEEYEVATPGEFIFIKSATLKIDVRIGGQTTEMIAGDMARYEEVYQKFYIRNPNPVLPIDVVLVCGFGDYNRLVLDGKIVNSITGLLTASGEIIADTRKNLKMSATPDFSYTPTNYDAGNKELILTVTKDPLTWGDFVVVGSNVFLRDNLGSGFKVDTVSGDATATGKSIPDLSIDSTVAAGRLCAGSGNTGTIKAWTVSSGGTFTEVESETLGSGAYGVSGVASDNDRGLVVAFTSKSTETDVYVLDQNLNILATLTDAISHTTSLKVRAAEFGEDGYLYIVQGTSGGTLARYALNDDYTLTLIETFAGFDSPATTSRLLRHWDESQRGLFFIASDGEEIYRVAFRDALLSMRLDVNERCDQGRLIKPDWRDVFITQADVTVDDSGGRSLVQGEVIKAILECYFKVFMPESYLDHVYEFHYSGGVVTGPVHLVSANRSYLAMGWDDNFSVEFPARISLVIDQRLEDLI